VKVLHIAALEATPSGRADEAFGLLRRAAADQDFGDWTRSEAAGKPLLAPIRRDPRFSGAVDECPSA
jgi:hypothetical protein